MKINTMQPEELHEKYNLMIASIQNTVNYSGPVFFTWLVVRPNSESIGHQHHEVENLIVVKGRGFIRNETTRHAIAPGDFITLDPFEQHVVENLSPDEELLLMSVIVDDISKIIPQPASENQQFPHDKYLIISTPPTPNGDLHLGHIAGPYLKADILRRFLIINGLQAYHLTGQDDHQSYTARKGDLLQWTPEQTADFYGNEIELTLKKSDIDLAYFSKPRIATDYIEFIQSKVKDLWEKGHIVVKDAPSLLCETCDRYLYEVYVRGLCPHCSTETGGNFCEACGKVNDCAELANPTCSVCGTTPTLVDMPRAYFQLMPHREQLANYHDKMPMNEKLREYCQSVMQTELPAVPVSHQSSWGIPCPIPGLEHHIISVWFEMGLGHMASANAFVKEKRPENLPSGMAFWTEDDATVLYSFGFDNSFFNSFVFPATCFALDDKLNPASALYFNQFYCLENLKFSTSRNHLIWAKDFLNKHTSDAMRIFLCKTSPESDKTSFFQQGFDEFILNFKSDISASTEILDHAVNQYFSGVAPVTGLWENAHTEFYKKLLQYTQTMYQNYHPKTFSLQTAADNLCALQKENLNFTLSEIHEKQQYSHTDEFRTSIALGLLGLKLFAMCAYPMMPRTANLIWQRLGYTSLLNWETVPAWVPYKQRINLQNIHMHIG